MFYKKHPDGGARGDPCEKSGLEVVIRHLKIIITIIIIIITIIIIIIAWLPIATTLISTLWCDISAHS